MAKLSRLNLPPFGLRRGTSPPNLHVPRGMLEAFARTITDWSRGLDSALAMAYTTPYVPQLTATTANPNLGTTGTAEGFYTRIGDFVAYNFVFIFAGTGITQGTGTYHISIPVPPQPITGSGNTSRGLVTIEDSGVGKRRFTSHIGTDVTLRPINATAYAADTEITDATVGLTFTAGDSVSGQVTYLAGRLDAQ